MPLRRHRRSESYQLPRRAVRTWEEGLARLEQESLQTQQPLDTWRGRAQEQTQRLIARAPRPPAGKLDVVLPPLVQRRQDAPTHPSVPMRALAVDAELSYVRHLALGVELARGYLKGGETFTEAGPQTSEYLSRLLGGVYRREDVPLGSLRDWRELLQHYRPPGPSMHNLLACSAAYEAVAAEGEPALSAEALRLAVTNWEGLLSHSPQRVEALQQLARSIGQLAYAPPQLQVVLALLSLGEKGWSELRGAGSRRAQAEARSAALTRREHSLQRVWSLLRGLEEQARSGRYEAALDALAEAYDAVKASHYAPLAEQLLLGLLSHSLQRTTYACLQACHRDELPRARQMLTSVLAVCRPRALELPEALLVSLAYLPDALAPRPTQRPWPTQGPKRPSGQVPNERRTESATERATERAAARAVDAGAAAEGLGRQDRAAAPAARASKTTATGAGPAGRGFAELTGPRTTQRTVSTDLRRNSAELGHADTGCADVLSNALPTVSANAAHGGSDSVTNDILAYLSQHAEETAAASSHPNTQTGPREGLGGRTGPAPNALVRPTEGRPSMGSAASSRAHGGSPAKSDALATPGDAKRRNLRGPGEIVAADTAVKPTPGAPIAVPVGGPRPASPVRQAAPVRLSSRPRPASTSRASAADRAAVGPSTGPVAPGVAQRPGAAVLPREPRRSLADLQLAGFGSPGPLVLAEEASLRGASTDQHGSGDAWSGSEASAAERDEPGPAAVSSPLHCPSPGSSTAVAPLRLDRFSGATRAVSACPSRMLLELARQPDFTEADEELLQRLFSGGDAVANALGKAQATAIYLGLCGRPRARTACLAMMRALDALDFDAAAAALEQVQPELEAVATFDELRRRVVAIPGYARVVAAAAEHGVDALPSEALRALLAARLSADATADELEGAVLASWQALTFERLRPLLALLRVSGASEAPRSWAVSHPMLKAFAYWHPRWKRLLQARALLRRMEQVPVPTEGARDLLDCFIALEGPACALWLTGDDPLGNGVEKLLPLDAEPSFRGAAEQLEVALGELCLELSADDERRGQPVVAQLTDVHEVTLRLDAIDPRPVRQFRRQIYELLAEQSPQAPLEAVLAPFVAAGGTSSLKGALEALKTSSLEGAPRTMSG